MSMAEGSIARRVRIRGVEVLASGWSMLKRTKLDYLRNDGTWQEQARETYDRGDGATILLYNLERRTIVLTRQFRFPAFVTGYDGLLIETPAGLLDGASPEERIRQECEEETGFRVREPRLVFAAYMSPGSVTERLYCYISAYDPADRVASGGGLAHEGEEIETLEPTIESALAMIADGRIVDGKTIMLIQHAALRIFPPGAIGK
jgi:nudix-type nucleoside diphosphatase (YffH/AdpP family)